MKNRSKQKGFALLLFVTALATATTALAIKTLNNNGMNTQIARDKITAAALAQAKDALIGYAITYAETHPGNVEGYLPCPDISGTAIGGEGAAEGSCGAKNVSAIGRFPWKTLDLPVLRGGDNECLWYTVSGTYKYNQKTDLMNWDTNGQLQVYASDGTTLLTPLDNQAVAVIFSPGTAAPGQNRSGTTAPVCGGNYTVSNYLDAVGTINNASVSNIANANSPFRIGDSSLNTSDRLVYITQRDIWNAIKKRNDFGVFVTLLLNSATTCLSSTPLPLPVAINFNHTPPSEISGGTAIGNLTTGRVPAACLAAPLDNWQDNLLYARCTSGTSCLNVNSTSCRGVVIFSGERKTSQIRITNTDKNTWSNYLEDIPPSAFNLTAFATGGIFFSSASSYSYLSPSTDVLACIP